ncbi:MAG: RHS repeat domain-containing protein [Blastocatellia bacterium]
MPPFTYDKKNRQETVLEPAPISRTTRWQYDVADQLQKVIAPSGRTMRYVYDERGQQQTITDGIGNNVTFGYDNRGNLTTLKDQRNNTTTFGYDELFRLTGRRDPLGRQVMVGYDPVGNVINQTDRMGRQTTIIYDNINRPKTVSYVDATVTYSYDPAGRWTSVSDASGAVTWQYDNANRVTAEVTNLGTVSYGYNNANQRNSMTAADRPPVNYGYDTAGRLQTISQTTGGVAELFTYGYDTLSRRTQLQRQNNGAGIVTTDYQYDEISRLKRLKHTRVSTGTLHEDFQYEYNLDDEITKITSLASAPLTPQSKTATTADAANRIPQFGTASYGFNQEGQTTAKTDVSGTTNYQWDARGRLTRATLSSGQVVDYGYDVLGRRTNRAANGLITTFQHDATNVVVDRVSDGSYYDYLSGNGVDDKLRQSGGSWGTMYFLTDHLGSTVGLAGTSGGLVETQQQYEAFGAGAGSVRTRYGYTGRERDDLAGLMYYRARWYDSQQGRFISEDPAGTSDGLNLYAYVGSNPLMYRDPSGNQREYDSQRFGELIPSRQSNSSPKKPPGVDDAGQKCCVNLVTDDAGRKCCETKTVILWNLTNEWPPHTFLQTPKRSVGVGPPTIGASVGIGKGAHQDDRGYVNSSKPIPYKVCSETLRKIEKLMDEYNGLPYSPFNISPFAPGAYNCTGWACKVLEDAGITPPLPSWVPYSNPWFANWLKP